MTYLEAVDFIRKIEAEYDVMSIRYKGICVWPFLRIYISDKLTSNREVKPSKSVVCLVLKCLFSFNFLRLFKKYDAWLFTACERRKRVGNKMIHRISGGISSNLKNCLMVEKPDLLIGHYKKKDIEEKDIISEAWLLMLMHVIECLFRPFIPRVKNEDILIQILDDKKIPFDYKHYLRLLNAQRIAMRMMMEITIKPKMVFIECPYTEMGYLWAFHQKGVKVIELQHGVLNRNHDCYNAIDYELMLNPDYMCVYGEEEYRYFKKDKPQYAPEVRMTGLYMLEKADDYFYKDIFEVDRKQYSKIIVVAGQANSEQQLSEFVDIIAQMKTDLLFIYIPRHNDEKLEFMSSNVRLISGVNIYEYLKWADVHVTVSSTTCLEAHYYHTPTIFININNLATEYYGSILDEKNGAIYINTAEEFIIALEKLDNQPIEWKELFAHNHTEKIKDIIKEITQI